MELTVDGGMLVHIGSLVALGGGAYVRLRMLERRVEEVKKECAKQVQDLRSDHGDYHELRADIMVIKTRLDSLATLLQQIFTPVVKHSVTSGGQD